MTALIDVKCPTSVSEAPGGAIGTEPSDRKEQVLMTKVQDVSRPKLRLVHSAPVGRTAEQSADLADALAAELADETHPTLVEVRDIYRELAAIRRAEVA